MAPGEKLNGYATNFLSWFFHKGWNPETCQKQTGFIRQTEKMPSWTWWEEGRVYKTEAEIHGENPSYAPISVY